jgi:hypothetical protein
MKNFSTLPASWKKINSQKGVFSFWDTKTYIRQKCAKLQKAFYKIVKDYSLIWKVYKDNKKKYKSLFPIPYCTYDIKSFVQYKNWAIWPAIDVAPVLLAVGPVADTQQQAHAGRQGQDL